MLVRLLLAMCAAAALADMRASGPGFDFYCTGNCTDVAPPTRAGMIFMGGGPDVDAGYKFLIEYSGGGNIVVLRTGPPGDDAYDSYIYGLGTCQSVATLIINDTIANEQSFVIDQIMNAEGLYFAGGDQSTYYNIWSNRGSGGKIADAINARVAQNVPVGGTSAGDAVLASEAFTAETGGVDSTEALMLPLSPDITLANNFLHLYPSVVGALVTDMHFNTRDRMGRLIAFLANAIHRGWPAPHGLACNEHTAMLLDVTSGIGTVVGNGPAYALSYDTRPTVLEKETPLTWKGISTQRLHPGDSFDFVNWKVHSSGADATYTLNVDDGDLYSKGNDGKIY